MQIEQFDTGLKTKTNVENIVLSPEKNFQNKNLIRGHLNKIITSGVSEIFFILSTNLKDLKILKKKSLYLYLRLFLILREERIL
jgi:hypothetical protein